MTEEEMKFETEYRAICREAYRDFQFTEEAHQVVIKEIARRKGLYNYLLYRLAHEGLDYELRMERRRGYSTDPALEPRKFSEEQQVAVAIETQRYEGLLGFLLVGTLGRLPLADASLEDLDTSIAWYGKHAAGSLRAYYFQKYVRDDLTRRGALSGKIGSHYDGDKELQKFMRKAEVASRKAV